MDSQKHNPKSDSTFRGADLGRTQWPVWLKFTVSVVLVVHFGLIGLVYFANNSIHRMPMADRLLQKCHPYLVGLGWYTELLPMSMVGTEAYDKPIRIDYRVDRSSRTWTSWIDSTTSDRRWKRLCQLAGALSVNEDEEGLGQIALSLAKRAKSSGIEINQIRFTTKDSGTKNNVLLYQATLVPIAGGELTLVPELESTRTVPVTKPLSP